VKKIILLYIFLTCSIASAITLNQLKDRENAIVFQAGYDYSLVTLTTGYARGVTLFDHSLMPYIQLSTPLFKIDIGDYRIDMGFQTSLFRYSGFDISTIFTPLIVRKTENDTSQALNFGSEFSIIIGYIAESWFAGTKFSYDYGYITHIEHTDIYKFYYKDVKDGWYGSSSANIKIGIVGGYAVTKTVEITTDLGIARTGIFKEYFLVPSYYANLGINYRY